VSASANVLTSSTVALFAGSPGLRCPVTHHQAGPARTQPCANHRMAQLRGATGRRHFAAGVRAARPYHWPPARPGDGRRACRPRRAGGTGSQQSVPATLISGWFTRSPGQLDMAASLPRCLAAGSGRCAVSRVAYASLSVCAPSDSSIANASDSRTSARSRTARASR
jgi:hypothetical protein